VDDITIKIANWDAYNPPSDRARHKYWFRVNQNIAMSQGLSGLSPEQCWVWVQLLAEACRKESATITIKPAHIARMCQVTSKTLVAAIEILDKNGTLTVIRQSTVSPLTENVAYNTIRTIQNNTIQTQVSTEPNANALRSVATFNHLDGFLSNISTKTIERISSLYPDQEFVSREQIKMQVWLEHNPLRVPKGKRGWARFVIGWLERGWERHRKTIQTNKPRQGFNQRRAGGPMKYETFQNQMARLKDTYGSKSYGVERQKILWDAFKKCSDEEFLETVTELIATYRSAPMLKEFDVAMVIAERRTKERLFFSGPESVGDILEKMYIPASYDDPDVRERILGRIKLVKDYSRGLITREQFDQALDFYESLIPNDVSICDRCFNKGIVYTENKQGFRLVQSCDCKYSVKIHGADK
jgi:hypothetical protein